QHRRLFSEQLRYPLWTFRIRLHPFSHELPLALRDIALQRRALRFLMRHGNQADAAHLIFRFLAPLYPHRRTRRVARIRNHDWISAISSSLSRRSSRYAYEAGSAFHGGMTCEAVALPIVPLSSQRPDTTTAKKERPRPDGGTTNNSGK